MDITWHALPGTSSVCGKTLAEANIRAMTGASVVALVRNHEVIPNPKSSTVFQEGDMIGLIGETEEVDSAVRLMPPEGEDINQVSARVGEALRSTDPGAQIRRTEVVGPQVGRDLAEQGGLALLFTMIGILFYVGFRFEKKMAAGTVLAALHDPLVILGFFAATQLTFDLAVLAAVLAVIGYSINDTVVVFDRVREVFLSTRKGTPKEMLNQALNETLSRTLMTSFSVLFVVVSLYLFGGETLKGFSIAIIVGVLIGTYSSIFIAAALVLDMKLKPQDLMPVKKDDAELDALP